MRRKTKPRKELQPDAVYNSAKVTKLINYLMQDGKKEAARKIVFGSLVVGVFIPGSLGEVSWVTFLGGIVTTSFLLVLALILSDKIKTISL